MFSKILVANRGEIACRIIRTARKMGISTVAVYSEVDSAALHVTMADEAVCIGPAPVRQSYLLIDRIVQACRDTGAEAVHPGYGFLSENSVFPEALENAGVTFIGPSADAVRLMGDKICSRNLAQKAGLPVVPGSDGVVSTEDRAIVIARDLGLPVMIKASSGGGGKGMRVARTEAELREGFRRAASEARSVFGDDRLLLEKYIEDPRHIEIQILSDGKNCLHLYERECSVQRRHQKVIEEAPSPFLDDAVRQAMVKQAITLAQAVGYRSAGTVEFVVDGNRNFYFLEMNTRLQVEHPVTELVTGLDLVEWMIRIAAGEQLTLSQNEIPLRGWAVEGRIYAEDPYRGFVPSTGRLVYYREPDAGLDVRVDTGVYEGGDISVHYDPMLAKLVTWGEDRVSAIHSMQRALGEFYIRGISHNIPFLASVLRHQKFQDGACTTEFVERGYPQGLVPAALPSAQMNVMACVAAFIHRLRMERDALLPGQAKGFERDIGEDLVVCFFGTVYFDVRVAYQSCRHDQWVFSVSCNGYSHSVVSGWGFCDPVWRGTIDERSVVVQVDCKGIHCQLHANGYSVDVMVLEPHVAAVDRLMPRQRTPDLSRFLLSPMPGLLVSIDVSEGQIIKAGEKLAVVEAMKMENVLRADQDATVKKIHVSAGGSLSVDQIIMEFS